MNDKYYKNGIEISKEEYKALLDRIKQKREEKKKIKDASKNN